MKSRKKKFKPIRKDPTLVDPKPLTMWGIQNFPTVLRLRYGAYCKASGTTIRDHLEFLLSKMLKDNHVDIPPIRRDNAFVFGKGAGLEDNTQELNQIR